MCLILTQLEPKIADKNIICYKIVKKSKVKGIYKSGIQGFEYIIRQLYTNHINIKYINIYIKKYYNIFTIGVGMFHSYANYLPTKLAPSSDYITLKCIIPKGSYYFEGYSNNLLLYASSQIKILEEI